jgi:hypothetical protein
MDASREKKDTSKDAVKYQLSSCYRSSDKLRECIVYPSVLEISSARQRHAMGCGLAE